MTYSIGKSDQTNIPRPEFPRPDWQRKEWFNLNGVWAFRFDHENEGKSGAWQNNEEAHFTSEITVPFSWASSLSGIGLNEKGIGWYCRTVNWATPADQSRLFLHFGAVDYECDVWINGQHVGSHKGGYGNFEFEITEAWQVGSDNKIVVRAEDFDLNHQARGKQGYGESRGIWQPAWIEARPTSYIKEAKYITFINGLVEVTAKIDSQAAGAATLSFDFDQGSVKHEATVELQQGESVIKTSFKVDHPQLWSPETPYLYEGELQLVGSFGQDSVSTYFGIREVGTARFDDRGYRWITLNGKPIYLNGTLDQAFHETGFFTYPSDEAMREEIYMMKRIGLNFVRIHIKPEEPRKLYWADKLGIMVMEDMPCFWGNPDESARSSYEREALEIIDRDFNHPSIFSWVMFNETWGLKTDSEASGLTSDTSQQNSYLPETQKWVQEKYHWAKQIDPSRIIEDNSPCNYDHVETDINTWHFYLNGYEVVKEHVEKVVNNTYPGSEFNYIGGNKQSDAPLMNSECGNVWGIKGGGAGDSDLAWQYRYMLNEFRRHNKMCGFVFTEFRDVINEFNGYYRLDGTDKEFGYEAFVPGMSLADLHTADFIVVNAAPSQTVDAGATVEVPLLRSSYSDQYHGQTLQLEWELWHDQLGKRVVKQQGSAPILWESYGVSDIDCVTVNMPDEDAVAVLALRLVDAEGTIITRNFTTFDVRSGQANGKYDVDGQIISVPVSSFTEQTFAYQWDAIQGSKVSGGEAGQFVYDIELPNESDQAMISDVEIIFEASSKNLLARNREGDKDLSTGINFMHGGEANVEYNPNTYRMTGEHKHESRLNVLVNGEKIGSFLLPDDPADSRGVLSYQYQPVDNRLEEAGSYGYLCKAVVPSRITSKLDRTRRFKLELQADEGGLALYGRNSGRYPIDLVVNFR